MNDISVTMYIEVEGDENKAQEISYILNEACSKIEQLKCNVFYKMKDSNNREIKLENY